MKKSKRDVMQCEGRLWVRYMHQGGDEKEKKMGKNVALVMATVPY